MTKQSAFCRTIVVLAAVAVVAMGGCGSSGSGSPHPTPASPDFTLTAPSAAVSVAQGASGSSTATAAVSGSFSAPIALTASGQPSGVYVGFSQTTIAAPGSGTSTLTIAVDPAVAPGNYSITVTGTGDSLTHTATVALTVTSATAPPGTPRLVGYLPDYDGSYATFATTLNFTKMTHLDLAFGLPPSCGGTCTASSNMTWALNQTDADIATLVTSAHNAGVKVLLSIGGGENSTDDQISAFYNVGLSTQLAASLDSYVTAHNLDGVDVDFEDPGNMGVPYATFVSDLIATEHAGGRIVTAAVAEWLQTQNVMTNATLQSYDFINVMVYSNLSDCQSNMAYFASLGEPANKMTVGVAFYGQSSDAAETYAQIIAAYPDAGQSNSVSGSGALDNGNTLTYVGDAEMAQETQFSLQYGGIMIWELSQDAAPPNSLLTVIQNNE
jgi:GH18 family chitinase